MTGGMTGSHPWPTDEGSSFSEAAFQARDGPWELDGRNEGGHKMRPNVPATGRSRSYSVGM